MNSGQMYYPIVLACDEAYAMPLATTLRSIVEANRSNYPLDFHIFSDGISEYTRRKVLDSLPTGSASIRWVEVDLEPYKKFSTLSHISKITFARFLIPTIFPSTVSKVLYLDADILVLDDLKPLWETKLQDALVGAVVDGLNSKLKNDDPSLKDVPRVKCYFNAGILLINLDLWRKEEIPKKVMEYLILHPNSRFSDQDALNMVCDGRWKKLDPRWNFVDYYEKVNISDLGPTQRPGIIHFATWEKPWNDNINHINADFYNNFRSRTCFPRTPLNEFNKGWSNLKNILRKYALIRAIWYKLKNLFSTQVIGRKVNDP
jgi:lipopolysaccharide biosynthesis glycosyltransferase